jgi:hypothetical protein
MNKENHSISLNNSSGGGPSKSQSLFPIKVCNDGYKLRLPTATNYFARQYVFFDTLVNYFY